MVVSAFLIPVWITVIYPHLYQWGIVFHLGKGNGKSFTMDNNEAQAS
jgi:hypothetical protein